MGAGAEVEHAGLRDPSEEHRSGGSGRATRSNQSGCSGIWYAAANDPLPLLGFDYLPQRLAACAGSGRLPGNIFR